MDAKTQRDNAMAFLRLNIADTPDVEEDDLSSRADEIRATCREGIADAAELYIQALDKPDEPETFERFVCAKCGGSDVQTAVWYKWNERKAQEPVEPMFLINEQPAAPHGTWATNWCEGCQDHPSLMTESDWADLRQTALAEGE